MVLAICLSTLQNLNGMLWISYLCLSHNPIQNICDCCMLFLILMVQLQKGRVKKIKAIKALQGYLIQIIYAKLFKWIPALSIQ